jgi:hypothetical protein
VAQVVDAGQADAARLFALMQAMPAFARVLNGERGAADAQMAPRCLRHRRWRLLQHSHMRLCLLLSRFLRR